MQLGEHVLGEREMAGGQPGGASGIARDDRLSEHGMLPGPAPVWMKVPPPPRPRLDHFADERRPCQWPAGPGGIRRGDRETAVRSVKVLY
jgi:hypothetical protein